MLSRLAPLLALLGLLGCATPRDAGDHYLRYVAFEVPGGEHVVLRWQKRQMPLRVHLPAPPAGLASDPAATLEVIRTAVLEWEDAAGEGVPSFEFVDDAGDADIPIVWEETPSGDWYVAHCAYANHLRQRRFGVARLLVTTRWQGSEVSLRKLQQVVMHEMGHALGLGGHSPDPQDVMYESVPAHELFWPGITARDLETLRLLYALPIGKTVVGARSAD